MNDETPVETPVPEQDSQEPVATEEPEPSIPVEAD